MDGARPLRILHVVEAYGGGLLRMVVELTEGDVATGHEALIAYGVRPETPADPRAGLDARVGLHPMPWTSRGPRQQAAAARELRRLVGAWRPDVVHLHSSFSGVLGVLVVPRAIPTVFSPHAFASVLPEGGAARRAAYRALETFVCRGVTLVGSQSDVEADLARKRGARAVESIHNGIRELDPEALRTRSHEQPEGRAEVVATGRTVPQRGVEPAARILARVREVADVAWLGGGGGSRGVAGAQALAAAGIERTGWLPREEVLDRVGRAAAYLHWTAWDTTPISVLEAMALDVPVVASDIPPNREVLGPTGVCATEDEAVALLRRLATDPGERLRLLEAQRARRTAYAARRMVRRWHEVYARLTGSAAATGGVPSAGAIAGA
ncbi:glycosyltransferase family 4 protein [Conexibacter sp. SYSU D00693]|uniref:glycosyltransferase family 4 protein n=1 Tax=Conexibacter sp. SYSU D00693 TaxID=2812560 RepID=UPI00196AB3A9|nr:glycosyltransferase family 4 protein [Conexibacter sp. SYSU D00693]